STFEYRSSQTNIGVERAGIPGIPARSLYWGSGLVVLEEFDQLAVRSFAESDADRDLRLALQRECLGLHGDRGAGLAGPLERRIAVGGPDRIVQDGPLGSRSAGGPLSTGDHPKV